MSGGQRDAEFVARPRERHDALIELQLSHMGSLRYQGTSGVFQEEPRQQRRDVPVILEDRPRLRAAFVPETRKPRRQIEGR